MRLDVRIRLSITAAALACCSLAGAAPARAPLPPGLALAVHNSGLPLKSFGLYAEPVDGGTRAALAAWNAEQPFLLASTAKVVTTLAALDLLGTDHRWRSQAFTTRPIQPNGRLAGDLVIVGGGAGITPADLRRWFKAMHGQGLNEVAGRIVLHNLTLLHDTDPAQAATSAEEASPGGPPEAREFLRGTLAVTLRPGSGGKAIVSLQPRPLGVNVINEVTMGGGCSAWATWRNPDEAGTPQLWVRGRWDASCGTEQITHVRMPPSVRLAPVPGSTPLATAPRVSTPALVAALWAESGGKLRGRVVEVQALVTAQRPAKGAAPTGTDDGGPRPPFASEFSTGLPELIREINKTSNNLAARQLLLSLGDGSARGGLRSAQDRVQGWLRSEGVADGDVHIDIGSGQSRAERGTPRAIVQLLHKAWGGSSSQAFVDSLPIAGVDGTLAHRLRTGLAAGQAWLKTGTLSDTRALAGYVRAKSGKVYAVAALANHADAARATPALDAFIEWVARNG